MSVAAAHKKKEFIIHRILYELVVMEIFITKHSPLCDVVLAVVVVVSSSLYFKSLFFSSFVVVCDVNFGLLFASRSCLGGKEGEKALKENFLKYLNASRLSPCAVI